MASARRKKEMQEVASSQSAMVEGFRLLWGGERPRKFSSGAYVMFALGLDRVTGGIVVTEQGWATSAERWVHGILSEEGYTNPHLYQIALAIRDAQEF